MPFLFMPTPNSREVKLLVLSKKKNGGTLAAFKLFTNKGAHGNVLRSVKHKKNVNKRVASDEKRRSLRFECGNI